jgi:hypothetical protein
MTLDGRALDPKDYVAKPLKKGARVVGGTILGRIGKTSSAVAPHVRFEIRPAGRGAPRIDPKPILDGWKLLESTAVYRSKRSRSSTGGSCWSRRRSIAPRSATRSSGPTPRRPRSARSCS